MNDGYRIEHDLLGDKLVPQDALYGVHTARALDNFPISGRPVHPELVRAFGAVKLACARTSRALGAWADDPAKADALEAACRELAEGRLTDHVQVDQLQGGAGTSTNMAANEVIANRALDLLGEARGCYDRVSPLDDVNLHQSTNDTFPTALRVAALRLMKPLHEALADLQAAFRERARAFEHVVKVGRTQLQDAVLITLGREMEAYADALGRDLRRVAAAEERLRAVNLGGTAIGTGIGAPRPYLLRVTETLREVTGLPFVRAENLIDATQNADAFAEVSGLLKATAVTFLKVCTDLRLMGSGPDAGLGEVRLPPRQAGSSIMPGKVNPVIPEAASQAAMRVIGNDAALTVATASGNFELNPFLPLVGASLLESIELLTRAADVLRRLCVEGLEANAERCAAHVHGSTATVTALLPAMGYQRASDILKRSQKSGRSLREEAVASGWVTAEAFDALVAPEAVCGHGPLDEDGPARAAGGR